MSSALASDPKGHTPRWAAPEVLKGADEATREADVFSFGMVVIEVGLVPPHNIVLPTRYLNTALDFYGKVSIQRVQHPVRLSENHQWRTAGSSAGGETTGSSEFGMGYDAQVFGTRPYSPADGGWSGQVSTRTVRGSSPHGTIILTYFLQLLAACCEIPFTHPSSTATGEGRR